MELDEKLLQHHKDAEWMVEGSEAAKNIDEETVDAIFNFAVNYVIAECRAGLGLDDIEGDEDADELNLEIFEKIQETFDEGGNGCYFCDSRIDPNKTEVNHKAFFCINCRMKLRNIFQSLGIPPHMVISTLDEHPVQKSKWLLHDGTIEVTENKQE